MHTYGGNTGGSRMVVSGNGRGGGGSGVRRNSTGLSYTHDGQIYTGLTTEAGSAADITQSKGDEELAERRVLFMGMPRSGKTSIVSVIFDGTQAYETLGMLPTVLPTMYPLMAGIVVYDFPGVDDYSETQYNNISESVYEGEHTSLVYVIDSQGDLQASLSTMYSIIRTAQSVNADIPINIFINKVDGLSDELKQDTQQDIQNKVMKTMTYESLNSTFVQFFLTTIYDESIREALSRVVRRLVPRYNTLETILNSFCSKSSLDKAFLFDMNTKIYLATDSTPTESLLYMFTCHTLAAIEEIMTLCSSYAPMGEEETGMQKTAVMMDGNTRIFVYQVNSCLALLCLVSLKVPRHDSLLDFNGSKIAKAIRKILP